jgi:uncharacterized phage protein (TIGR02216 family)
MQLGLGTLRLSPADFWRSTLRELTAALPPETPALERHSFNDLMRRFPDR